MSEQSPNAFKFEGDALVAQMLPDFLNNRVKDLKTIRALMTDGDWTEIRRLGHNMKGSGAAFGLPPVSEFGGRIEMAALEANTEAMDSVLDELQEFLNKGVDIGGLG